MSQIVLPRIINGLISVSFFGINQPPNSRNFHKIYIEIETLFHHLLKHLLSRGGVVYTNTG